MQNINETLDQAIKDRDMESIRRALNTWILQDPGFTKGVFDEKLRYCRDRGISETEIFVPFKGEALNEDPSTWTDRYFASAKTEFDSNFSRERLAHLRKVGGKLFPRTSTSSTSSNEEAKKKSGGEIPASDRQTSGKNNGLPWWLIPIGIGAAALIWLLSRGK